MHHHVVPSPSTPRDARSEATRRHIYATALALFTAEGFDGVSVSRVAREAGVSVPTLYAHFGTKDGLVLRSPDPEALAAALAGQSGDVPIGERLRRTYTGWFARLTPEQWDDTLTRWRIIAGSEELRLRTAENERRIADQMLPVLAELAGRPLTQREELVVLAYLSAYTVALLAWADGGGTQQLIPIIDEAVEGLLGVRPGSPAPPEE